LETLSFEPIIAGNGASLELLKREFPALKYYNLPGCEIEYTKYSNGLFIPLLLKTPCFIKSLFRERKEIKQIINKEGIAGIISDNRFGVNSSGTPSVYISHQITVFSGILTPITTFIHRIIRNTFDECWIPDNYENGLSGKLGHPKRLSPSLKYLGLLSRFGEQKLKKKYDILLLLSGPEPQRNLLEEKLIRELKNYNGKICLVRGTKNGDDLKDLPDNWVVHDLLLTEELQNVIASSKLVLTHRVSMNRNTWHTI
jgi:hypothetical protein